MIKQKTKIQLILELEEAQKRIAELEREAQLKAGNLSKSAGQAGYEDEALYRNIIEQTHDGIVILDEQGNVIIWNSAQEGITGIPKGDAIGQKYWDVQFRLLTPEARAKTTPERIKDALQNTFKTGEYHSIGKLNEANLQAVGGEKVKIIQSSPFAIKSKDGFHVGTITRDITGQKRAADAIHENEERFSRVFHASPAQMAITDLGTGKYIDVNKSFLQTLGFAQEEVIDKTASELNLFFDINQRAVLLEKMGKQGYLREEDVLVRTKTGDLRHGVFSAEYIQVQKRQFLLTVMNDVTERKEAEEALRKSTQILYESQAIANLGSWTADLHTGIFDATPEGARLVGWTPGKHSIDELMNTIHPDDREYMQSSWAAAMRGAPYDIEHRIILNGETRWLRIKAKIKFDEKGDPISALGITQDITERKRGEEERRDSEEKYRLLAENITDVIWIMDIESSQFLYVSPSVTQLRGYSADEVLSLDTSNSLTPESGQYLAQILPERLAEFERGITKAHVDELEQPCKDGSTVWTETTTRFVKKPETGRLEVYGVSRNITERKKAEAAIHLIENRNAALIEHAPDGIAMVDIDGVFTFASPSAYRMFGYNMGEIVGTQSREKVHPQDVHLLAGLRNQLYNAPEKTQTVEYRFLHKDGSYHWLESTYTNMFNEPSIAGIVINFRDITERKLTEEITRQQNEQLRLLYEASQQLNRTLDLKEIYQAICDFMSIIAPSDTLFISGFDHETQLITCNAYWMNGIWLDVSPFPAIPLEEEGKGTQSIVIRSGNAILSNDYQSLLKTTQNVYYVDDGTNEIFDEDPPEEELTQSALIVPLKAGGKVTGVIQAASFRKNAYTENQLMLLESLTLHIASAKQNATLYAKMQNELNERRQAEVALRASEEKYRVLIESLDNVVASVDTEGRFLYMNDMAAGQLGDSTEKLIGKSMYELFPEAIASGQMRNIQQVIGQNKGKVIENISMIQGEPRWYRTSIQPIHDEDGNVNQVLINSTDIHSLKTVQQELQELNRTLEERVQQRTAEVQDLYNNAPAGYHSLDANGNVIMINQTELDWLGRAKEEVMGRSIFNLFTQDSIAMFRENFPAFKKRGSLRDLELEFVRKNGDIIPILVNATAVYDEQGNYTMSRSTVLDNTEHKAADEALRSANLELARAMRMKDEFLASMSHELRTPLNGILGLSEALQLDVYGPLNEKQKSTLVHVENSGHHLLELINDILDVSKIEAGKFELEMAPCSLGDICQSSIQLTKGIAGKKRQNVNFTMSPASITINADARRLKQVLVNLLSNAVKFTPENGSIGLEVTENESDNIVYMTVWDKGIGISPKDIKKLFQPFVQLDSSLSRQQTGTGLGLTLVQRLVEMHGGSIEIQSIPGQGSRFTVALPCLSVDSATEIVENAFLSKFHYALIVEDEVMDAGHLARYCRALGVNPILHSTGKDTIERVKATRPNIIFLDIHLPDISGWDVLAQLKANPETQSIPVVITSVDDEKKKAFELNADGYLVKFFTISDLRTTLANLQNTQSTDETYSALSGEPIATVIIVDDNEINIETVVDYLGAKNFNVISARSGVDFLARVPQLHPDIVLMDIQMPEMDGLEAIRRLRAMQDQRLASVPVVALTALAMPGDRELCIEAGADEYVTKPFRLKEINELILQMLEDKKRIT